MSAISKLQGFVIWMPKQSLRESGNGKSCVCRASCLYGGGCGCSGDDYDGNAESVKGESRLKTGQIAVASAAAAAAAAATRLRWGFQGKSRSSSGKSARCSLRSNKRSLCACEASA